MKKNVVFSFIFNISYIIFILSCSSAPKRAMVFTETTKKAYDFYERGNAAVSSGDVDRALSYLDQAYALAVSVDNNDLICKILLSAVSRQMLCEQAGIENVDYVSAGEDDSENRAVGGDTGGEAKFVFGTSHNIDELILEAKIAASYSNEREFLESVVKVYECRIQIEKAVSNGKTGAGNIASKIQGELDSLIKPLEKQPYYLAYLYRTKGECSVLSKDDLDAAKYFEKAAEIHSKERYLSDIGYDWYLVAQSYSRAGKKDQAIGAIQNAIKYDKDAENSSAIAQDFMAVAYILTKGSPSASDKENAREYAKKAKRIYEAIGDADSAAACDDFLNSL